MRAAVYYGPHDIRVEQRPEPADPGPGEVVLEVARASICGTDASEWAYGPRLVPLTTPHPATGKAGPVVLGHELVGRVVAAGPGVEGIAVGDRVVPGAGISCGACRWCRQGRTNLCARYYTIGLQVDGGLAEYCWSPASICRRVPDGVSDDAAAIAQPVAVALHALDRGRIGAGEAVLVIGVGGIGAFALAGAVGLGASQVIAVDVDDARLELARRLGATTVLDGRTADVAAEARALTGGDGVDAAVECAGAPGAVQSAVSAARRGGRVVMVGLPKAPPAIDTTDASLREVDLVATLAHVCDADLPRALDLLATSPLAPVVTDRVIGLDDVVPEGIQLLAEGRASGKIVVDPRG